ncbi:pyridoxal-phosphate dependent enzyme [Longimicrobium terrae]|uniref:Cystathionine beta-synthase n=1 Tax=Longimicrobium terrae TaxID=1639882 RepID=A0A841GRG1_9BACT|nr:pyridoxal-phosphate dependent enzyme [Longimicrobium terrae]MBB4635327.1 cystathionine beta-synthase [Longimicrobium terrae]MBB6069720.1 cystathionine beta-synthase [Longimicrobium terrae]NNC31069.1 pyridoxal-phosphate dependent enzyme [Longimicrobium terrae]
MSDSVLDIAFGRPRHERPYHDVLGTVGWTPLIRLNRTAAGIRTPIYGKAEFMNPGGSVKDRIGPAIIEAAEREGRLLPGGTVVEGTSGNTGVGLALAAAIKGYRCVFTIPDKMSQEKVRLLKAFGAEVIVTPTAVAPDHPDNYVMMAKRIAEETPNAILANQFYNQANPEAHYRTTGPEIWEQTEGRVTHFVSAAGTGGTITGVGRYLKEKNPDVRIIGGDPVGSIIAGYWKTGVKPEGAPYKVEGIGQDKIPGTLDMSVVDEWRSVEDRDSMTMARRLTREEGLFVGGSAGLIAHVALQVAREIDDPDALVVFLLCDTGERYLTKVFNDEWMRENRLLEPARVRAADMVTGKGDGAPRELVSVSPETPVRQALGLITHHDVSQLPVLAEGDCVGHLAEASVMARVLEDMTLLDKSVQHLMEPPLPVVDSHVDLPGVTRLLSRQNPAVLVRRGGRLEGIITRHDVLRYLTDGR